MPPALLIEKIVTMCVLLSLLCRQVADSAFSSSEEVVELFAVFFEHCHRQCPFLDPEVHTPTATGSRSPFLFTCSAFASSTRDRLR